MLLVGVLAGCVEDYGDYGATVPADASGFSILPPLVETMTPEVAAQPAEAFAQPTAVPPALTPVDEAGQVSVVAVPTALPTQLPTQVPLPMPTVVSFPTAPPTATADPFRAMGAPARLQIPAIGVDAVVEQVGLTPERQMDVPRTWMNVGWYREGFYPGEVGNAVVDGHLDSTGGGPAVFWDLDKLVPGDEVIVTYQTGDQFTFSVQGRQAYAFDTKDQQIIGAIFGSSLTPDLNLITCDGAWDHGKATYTQRLVVFTTLEPEKTVRVDAPEVYQ
jgi:sortase (surface protein transpeptidase)